MTRTARFVVALLSLTLAAALPLSAQMVQSPIYLDGGVGGGVSLPNGKLADGHNTGWHAGAKARLGGWLPINLTAMGRFNSLPAKEGDFSDEQIIIGAGAEYALPFLAVHPYVGLDYLYVDYDNKAPNVTDFTRSGLGLGVGMEFALPGLGGFDTEIKYQWLNLWGKETGEEDLSQIAATITLMFDLL